MKIKTDLSAIDSKQNIIIKNAAVNNLKHIDVVLPRNRFIVVTGVSGSGKSSLAFDTLYAEGQRRYVESLSAYARQFMGKMDKPEVEYIKGISPAIAIEQKVNTRNPRSTVGTSTEIYDYLKLLYARIGKTYSPVSGQLIKKHTVSDVVDYIMSLPRQSKVMLFTPLLIHHLRSVNDELQVLIQKGFTRIELNGEIKKIEDVLSQSDNNAVPESNKKSAKKSAKTQASPSLKSKVKEKKNATEELNANILVDRLIVDEPSDEAIARIADSVQIAFSEGNGICLVSVINDENSSSVKQFSSRFEADGISFEEPSVNLFSFNNPYGACKRCEGFGSVIGIDPDLVVPDKSLSVYEGAIACWRGEKMSEWNKELVKNAYRFDFPIHKPFYELTSYHKQLLWTGNEYFRGLNDFFADIESQNYKIQYRVMLSRYRGKTVCPDCKGSRLRPDANYVKVGELSITDIVLMPVKRSLEHFRNLRLDSQDAAIAKRLLTEITNRLQFLDDVGLGYLTLNRLSNTLSGGESQRINLATSLGSSLVGSMYILDEPSIGLHPCDTVRLIKVLKSLQKLGNTLIVVEHDEEIMRSADMLVDIGPMAGSQGGNLVFQGSYNEMLRDKESLTARYLSGIEKIETPALRRVWKKYVGISGARENNLKNLDVKIPLEIMTVITGVSGSGKTSLIKKVLYPALKKIAGGFGEQSGSYDKLHGDYQKIKAVEMIDQNPIGKTSRSNPVTYVKAYDEIRLLYADLPLSVTRKLKPSHFSFNVEGGRCENCQGEGIVTIEMQFMADLHLKCDVCNGKRFKEEVLAIRYREKGIDEILEMTVDEALEFFNGKNSLDKFKPYERKISNKLQPLQDVGLGYIRLGQSSSTLSGGEAQRIKLASYLSLGNSASDTLFIFDEPTTSLHFHDISKLMDAFNALIKQGNSIIVIEHNTDVIKCADWVIDLGPEGGDEGGYIVFEGKPEDLVKCNASHTGMFLRGKI